jgi:hypothetical protein
MNAPWNESRLRQFWNQSGIITESHFGVDYDGSVGQYLESTVRADANVSANSRALAAETASNLSSSDRWTAAQVTAMILLMRWAYHTHGIPARICRSSTDPGFGVHNMFSSWSGGGTVCPGKARSKQFRDEIFPAFRAVIGKTGDKVPTVPVKPKLAVSSVQPGKINTSVKVAQVALINKGQSIPSGPTGKFGNETLTAYKAWQKKCGLKGTAADGVPGSASLQKLLPTYQVV